MTYPVLRFMAAPDTAAAVRFDFNSVGTLADEDVWPAHEGFSLGAPSLEGDPDSVGVEYAPREIEVPFVVRGNKGTVRGVMSRLARELQRPRNWLMFQLSEFSEPMWFRTYRSSLSALDFELVLETSDASTDLWGIPVSLDAEPWAYGSRVTLPTVTVANDPAAPLNPCFVVLPAVKGDAPAPLRVSVDPSNGIALDGFRWLLASASLEAGSVYGSPVVWQVGSGDVWSAGVDTGSAVSDSAMSAGSYRAVSFSTQAGLVTRLSGVAPSAPVVGRYKVLVRVARSDTASKFSLRFGQARGTGYVYGDTVTMGRDVSTATGHATWVDLGEFAFPFGTQAPPGEEGTLAAPDVALQVGRTTGSGSAWLDAIMLVPAWLNDSLDNRILLSEFPDLGIPSGPGVGIWDGDHERFWSYDAAGALHPSLPELVGGFPRATPGAVNVLHVLQQAGAGKPSSGADSSDSLTATTAVTVSYHPRFLWLGSD